MILKSFLELLRGIAFFEDIAESNLSIFDFDIQEGEYVTKISSNNYWKIYLKIVVTSFIRKKLIVSSNALGVEFVTTSFTNRVVFTNICSNASIE